MLPVVVWLVGWFEWWLGLPAAALLVGALRRPLSGPWRLRAPTPAEAAVLAVAALWVLATAAGGEFDPRNLDFISYQVMLLDLGPPSLAHVPARPAGRLAARARRRPAGHAAAAALLPRMAHGSGVWPPTGSARRR